MADTEAKEADSIVKSIKPAELSKTELTLIVRSNEAVLFEGKCISIAAENIYGYFDILPRHKNFITNIHNKIVIHINDKEEKEIAVDSGILRIYNNEVDIFMGIETVDMETPLIT